MKTSGRAPDDLLQGVAAYYGATLAEHGPVAQGVDWNGEASQCLRFAQLCRLLPDDRPFSINDLGCGYGAFARYLAEHYDDVSYLGTDICPGMITAAECGKMASGDYRFEVGQASSATADYSVASGIFNVRPDIDAGAWHRHLLATLHEMDRQSRLGFAFNCLTSYSDAELMQPHLHYADPCELFHFCKSHFSRDVALLHDYGLYEFTLIVRKEP